MRLFVALNLPDRVRQGLWDAVAGLRELGFPVRWVRPEGIHLTVKFLGEVAAEQEPALREALTRAAAGGRPLPVAMHGFGVFPDHTRPRVIWAGLDPDPALELLQHRVEQEFAPLGFPTEGRPFHPHLTLGRAARDARPQDFRGLAAAIEVLRYDETVLVGSVDLMQSVSQGGGMVYHVRHSERLP